MDNYWRYYEIFGLNIRANIDLPELPTSSPTPHEISILVANHSPYLHEAGELKHRWMNSYGEPHISISETSCGYKYEFHGLATFSFLPEESVLLCSSFSKDGNDSMRHLLLDQLIPRILSRRTGNIVVHAGGIKFNEQAVLFLGKSGLGKSTLCALLLRQGYPVLSDDAILLNNNKIDVVALPGYAGLRLLNDSYLSFNYHLGEKNNTTQRISPHREKHNINLSAVEKRCGCSLPVRAIFELQEPEKKETISITPIRGYRAATSLLRNCFRFDPTDSACNQHNLLLVSKILAFNKISFFSLSYPRDHKQLDLLGNTLCTFIRSLF